MEDRVQILQRLPGLALDVGAGQFLGARNESELSGCEDKVACPDSLRVWTDGWWGFCRCDDLFLHECDAPTWI